MSESARFWDRIARKYAAQPVADEAAYQRKLAMTRARLKPQMMMLEIGCGTGSTAIAHAPHVGHVRAVDISARMIEIARAKAEAAGRTNITFEVAPASQLDLATESADAVLALSLLHLVPDRDALIGEIRRALVPGGIFVSNTACIGDMSRLLRLVLPIGQAIGKVPFLRTFTADELQESITRAGFEIEERYQQKPSDALFLIARKPG